MNGVAIAKTYARLKLRHCGYLANWRWRVSANDNDGVSAA